ncbi:MAG: DNA-directed DNA polymerase II small subunit [Methermicoccaceae archaeon]
MQGNGLLEVSYVVEQIASCECMVEPEAAQKIVQLCDKQKFLQILDTIQTDDVFLLTSSRVDSLLTDTPPTCEVQPTAPTVHAENNVNVLWDVKRMCSNASSCDSFVQHFRSRCDKLHEIMKKRQFSSRPISSLERFRPSSEGRDNVSISGLVADMRTTRNGHTLIELEDSSGSFAVLVPKDSEVMKDAHSVVPDEMLGVRGTMSSKGGLLIANELVFPDVSLERNQQLKLDSRDRQEGDDASYAVLTSDIHVGSKSFIDGSWHKFVDWLNGDAGGEKARGIAERVRYLLVAGDLVEGVGIYPNQEKDLSIDDAFEQYEVFASMVAQIPDHIQIVLAPGNHDAIRQGEPQPPLGEQVRAMFSDKITFVGNPCLVEVEGVRVLMYHGRSIPDFISSMGSSDLNDPITPMKHMLIKRHLSPIYGGSVPLVPEPEDRLVIEHVPDILHCGHVHIAGHGVYRGVRLINSGAWQAQTDYQKMRNIVPTPGRVPVVELSSLKTTFLNFG